MTSLGGNAGSDPERQWTEAASERFADLANVFVPARAEQIETICALIPAALDDVFNVVELGAGEGALSQAVLERFPHCRYLALDGSEVMRNRLKLRFAGLDRHVDVRHFLLEDQAWRHGLPSPLRCVLASLVVHHLPGEGKRRLFADLAARLEPDGALILADLVEPPAPQAARLFAAQWDDTARRQSLEEKGSLEAFELFQRDRWNFFADPAPDPYDQPSPLVDQLIWLREAGFTRVDCFWMRAGHAIFGGYR
jgi:tRNA (cmo5U34)-methyltransferase